MAYTTIDDPTIFFNTKLYTGNNTGQSITGVGFQPDWVWIKSRTDTNSHNSWDSVRGVNKYLENDTTKIETTVSNGVTSFDSDGFTVGSRDAINDNGLNFVSWNWLAGGSASSNTDGSITSSVSANTTSGFSIVSYTGTGSAATVGHGLSSAPSMVIIKNRDDGQSWRVGVTSIGFDKYLGLNGNGAATSSSGMFNNTAPTTSVFSVGSDGSTNASGEKCIAYCFADTGNKFFKAGSYTGNANNDGPYIHLGFKPAFLVIKQSSSARNWIMMDNKRSPFNIVTKYMKGNSFSAEETYNYVDFLSNGFKCRDSDTGANASGGTYIYYAFAESPFVNSNGVPNNAR